MAKNPRSTGLCHLSWSPERIYFHNANVKSDRVFNKFVATAQMWLANSLDFMELQESMRKVNWLWSFLEQSWLKISLQKIQSNVVIQGNGQNTCVNMIISSLLMTLEFIFLNWV